jgi:cyclopropane-fatty-acyl-phospholipid synthase
MLFWNGERWRFGASSGLPSFVLQFKTRIAFVRTMLQSTLGLGESYVAGEIAVEGNLEDALTKLYELGMREAPRSTLARFTGRALSTLTMERTKFEEYYGRSSEFHGFYLDKKLQYSCGYFKTPEDSLDRAQDQKLAHTLRKLDLRRGQRLLDIGCGWGHLMFQAAEKHGVECLGITSSDEQTTYIREQARIRKLPVKARTMNFHDLDERSKWDRIVSLGTMRHVGGRRADAFYDKLSKLSAPKGIVLAQSVAKMNDDDASDPFVEKHVFPGYWSLSCEGETKRAVARGFNVVDVENLRRHYALTVHHWRKNFLANYEGIKRKTRYRDRFLRTWDFYLASVVAGLRAGHLNLIALTMSNGINDEYPLTRDFLYEMDRPRAVFGAIPTLPFRSRTTALS